MKSITVFCGSSCGNDEYYTAQAILLGKNLAQRNIQLVYGGSKIGLMGAVADGALSEGGKVVGVLPNFLKTKEIVHENLTELILVESMQERKTIMYELCDGAIALPGGFGTMEELFEMLTWAQLGLHQKPILMYNINSFYDHLILMIQAMVDKGLLKEINQQMLLTTDNMDEIFERMKNYIAPTVEKWITNKTI